MPSLTQLAEEILANAKLLDSYISSNNLPPASFNHDSLANLPPDLQGIQTTVIDTAQSIRKIVLGPIGLATEILHSPADITDLRVIYTYNIPKAVPLNGSSTYAEIAHASGLSESLVYRFLRHAMANRIFCEASPGRVAHTAVSRMMVEDAEFFDLVGMMTHEIGPAFMKVPEALTRFPNSGEANETAYSLANNTNLSLYNFLADKPERARRFGESMKFITKGEAFNIKHLTSTYDWAALDAPGTVLVDVGGGHGSVAQHLADSTQNMKFIVQDIPSTVQQGSEILPENYKSRIEFSPRHFFTEQTVKGKDIYFFRWIFHNLSDAYCIKILKGLVPAMRKGARVLVFEMVMPEEPQTGWIQKKSLDADMMMSSCFNGRERNIHDWRYLFVQADSRFLFKNVTHTPGSSFSLIEHVWGGCLIDR